MSTEAMQCLRELNAALESAWRAGTLPASVIPSKLAQRCKAALAAPEPKAEAGCDLCNGSGELFVHAEDCHDDLCALNGDEHSCCGMVIDCGCAAPPEPQPEHRHIALIIRLLREAHATIRGGLTGKARGDAERKVLEAMDLAAETSVQTAQPEQAAQAQAGQAVEEIGGVPVTWWQQDGCRNRHYTPENIGAIIADLKECEQGREVPEWVYRDHRGRCGVLWRVMSALYYGIDPAAPSQPEAGRVGLTVPQEIAAIIERLHTQNNRITDNPLFAVQQKRVIGGLDADYADKFAWLCDGCEVGAEESAQYDAMREVGDPLPDDVQRVGYREVWEFVTGCFTEQGCKDYIARNGHNLKEPRIYAYGSYRNAELIALRKWLMSLAALPAAKAEG